MEEKSNVKKIPQYKKIWYSINKFEKYPEMSAEGVGRAFLYLITLLIMFAIIISIVLLYKTSVYFKEGIRYIDENVEEINYNDGMLTFSGIDDTFYFEDIKVEFADEYAEVTVDNVKNKYLYKDVFDVLGINKFDKEEFINFLKILANNPRIYIMGFIVNILIMFCAYFVSTLIDVLVLSLFGVITAMIAKLKMRYRAIFNMSIYSITLSVILEVIYLSVKSLTGFNVKYFSLMYTAIAYICLIAAIFMIRSDLIKQQIELMRIIEKKQKEPVEEDKKEEKKEEEKENKEDKEREKEEEKKEEKSDEGNVESQGSNA